MTVTQIFERIDVSVECKQHGGPKGKGHMIIAGFRVNKATIYSGAALTLQVHEYSTHLHALEGTEFL